MAGVLPELTNRNSHSSLWPALMLTWKPFANPIQARLSRCEASSMWFSCPRKTDNCHRDSPAYIKLATAITAVNTIKSLLGRLVCFHFSLVVLERPCFALLASFGSVAISLSLSPQVDFRDSHLFMEHVTRLNRCLSQI